MGDGVFEQEQSEAAGSASVESAEPRTEKKLSSVVLLAAGGVLVATICATLASMLATGSGSKPEAGPPKAKAEVEGDQPSTTSTSISVAPDGSTATVVITVPGSKAKGEQAVRNAAGPADGEVVASEVVETSAEGPTSAPRTTKRPPSTAPSVPSSSSVPVTTSSSTTSATAPAESGEPGKP